MNDVLMTVRLTTNNDFLPKSFTYIVGVIEVTNNGIQGKYRLEENKDWACGGGTGLFLWKHVERVEKINEV